MDPPGRLRPGCRDRRAERRRCRTRTATGDSDGDDTEPEPEPPITWDIGVIPDSPPTDQLGCQAVDFLFVIDNSGSMGAFQTNLISNFATFIGGIQKKLEEVDSYHVGVTPSDAYAYNVAGCNDLGSLVVRTGGFGSSFEEHGEACGPYVDGASYMTEEDDLEAAFNCAAQVGTQGDAWELMATSMIAAIDGSLAGPGQCNEGFIRDDALLVIVLITDEADGPGDPEGAPPEFTSEGDPDSWHDAVVAAKGGIPENAAVVALTNYADGPCVPNSTVDDGANLVEFADLFGDNGFVGGICELDYGPIFSQAVDIIEGACDNFVPG